MHTQMKPKDLIDWRDHATQEELDRVLEITANRLAGTQEITAIRNRCYQRARRKEGKS